MFTLCVCTVIVDCRGQHWDGSVDNACLHCVCMAIGDGRGMYWDGRGVLAVTSGMCNWDGRGQDYQIAKLCVGVKNNEGG